jgi:ABC-type transport system involved in multi-copper enzyme maturation permease subunit
LPELGFGMLVTFIAFLSENIAATIGFSLGFMVAAPYIEYINGFKDYFITHQVNGFYQDVLKGFSRSDVFTDIVTIAAYLIVFYSGSMLVLKRKDILL